MLLAERVQVPVPALTSAMEAVLALDSLMTPDRAPVLLPWRVRVLLPPVPPAMAPEKVRFPLPDWSITALPVVPERLMVRFVV